MKNPHNIPPTRYMKRKESQYAIYCHYNYGLRFSNDRSSDISIECNNNKCTCSINNNCNYAYDCNSKYQSLLFTNSNSIEILDYEVFTIDYQGKETIYYVCKYPDIIWEYIQTNNISNEALLQIYDDKEGLLNDLDLIHSDDDNIRAKIKSIIKNPSIFLPNTTIVEDIYDSYLKEWIGSYTMKLIYRASEHGFKAESFHKYSNIKDPTLIIMKSTDGWIFGGYTTQSWESFSDVYNHDSSYSYNYYDDRRSI